MLLRPGSVRRLVLSGAVLGAVSAAVYGIDFDTGFGAAGKFITTFSSTGQPTTTGTTVFLQPSGRLIVLGNHQQDAATGRTNGFVMAGLTTGGILDTTFGDAGKIFNWSFISSRNLIDSAMLPDGSILTLTQFIQAPSTNLPILLKYTPTGQNDSGFSSNLQIGEAQTVPVIMTLGANGKIYVLVRQAGEFSILRLNADGSRDTEFAPNGVRLLNLKRLPDPTIFGLIETDGGRLLLAGSNFLPSDQHYRSFVARLDPGGNFDRGFGIQGIVRLHEDSWASVMGQTMAVQPDRRILIGGYLTEIGSKAILIRLTPRGRFDSTFGTRGVAVAAFDNWNGIRGISIAQNGQIVVAGHCGAKAIPPNEKLFVARFSTAGVRESSLVTNIITNRDAGAFDVAVQPDGKIVIAATTINEALTGRQLASARFLP